MRQESVTVIFSPSKELVKEEDLDEEQLKKLKKDDEEYTPFIQIKMSQSEIQDRDTYIKKFRSLQLQIQEMKLNIETQVLN